MTFQVRIDPTLCRGHAICALYFAAGVELDQWGFGRVVDASPSGRRAVRKARRAAAACPNGAVVVTEHPDPVPVPVPVTVAVAGPAAVPTESGTPATGGVPGAPASPVPAGPDHPTDALRW
jgi:ferredoxin